MANCSKCGEKFSRFDLFKGLCPDCYASERKLEAEAKAASDEAERASHEAHKAQLAAIMLTTESSSDLGVETRLGVIAAEYVVGLNIFRDIASSARDFFGGRSETMQRGLKEAKEAALAELREQALAIGADAVVAIDLDYSEISGGGKSMLFLVASGTAVKLKAT